MRMLQHLFLEEVKIVLAHIRKLFLSDTAPRRRSTMTFRTSYLRTRYVQDKILQSISKTLLLLRLEVL